MTPYYADRMLTILAGDCREVMAAMEPESVPEGRTVGAMRPTKRYAEGTTVPVPKSRMDMQGLLDSNGLLEQAINGGGLPLLMAGAER